MKLFLFFIFHFPFHKTATNVGFYVLQTQPQQRAYV
jgi:hypothetical protein